MNLDTPHLWILPIEEEARLRDRVTAEDIEHIARFSSSQRRAEFLSWRAALYSLLGRTCPLRYNDVGAPLLPEGWGWISVSHSRAHIALLYSPYGQVAIDIDSLDRPYRKLASRYLKPQEELLSEREEWLPLAWSAKEVLYKLAGRKGLDLREELHIDRLEWGTEELAIESLPRFNQKITPEGVIHARIGEQPYRLAFALLDEECVVWNL